MKKLVLRIAMVMLLLLLFTSCSANDEKEVKLTKENIKNYLSIKANVNDSNIYEDSGSVYGVYYKNYSGDAEVEIDVVNQTSAKFNNVTIECEIYTFVDKSLIGDTWYGWEFENDNINTGESGRLETNRKRITINLPNDGNWTKDESLTFVSYGDQIGFLASAPVELSICGIEILSVTGTVTE